MTPFHFYRKAPPVFADPAVLVVPVPPNLRGKQELLGFLAQRLSFPDYFGNNWDALDECLRDLSWLKTSRVILVHSDLPLAHNPQEVRVYLDVLRQAVEDRFEGTPHLEVWFPGRHVEQVVSALGL